LAGKQKTQNKTVKPEWWQAVSIIQPHVVKIQTPGGHGTGFLCHYAGVDSGLSVIATAYHVVEHANDWREPLRITHGLSSENAFIAATERAILVNPQNDSAVVLVSRDKLPLPADVLALLAMDRYVVIGAEVAWLGFPSVAPASLCFFSGNVSAVFDGGYLIDGVAINGVSGGPVFFIDSGDNSLKVVGAITEYRPNIGTGRPALPGLSFAQSVTHFHSMIGDIKSMDEAQHKQREQAQKAAEASTGQAVPPPDESTIAPEESSS
jgi:hypothetical protein